MRIFYRELKIKEKSKKKQGFKLTRNLNKQKYLI